MSERGATGGIGVEYGISNLSLDLRTQFLGPPAAIRAHLDAISPDPSVEVGMELTPNRSVFMRGLLARGRDIQRRSSAAYGDVPIESADAAHLADLNRMLNRPEDEVFGRIISGHASFLDETPGRGFIGLLFPGTAESLEQLGLVRWALGKRLDGVVYGRHLGEAASYTRAQSDPDENVLWTPFRSTRIQPKHSDFGAMDIPKGASAEGIMRKLKERGIDSGTLDVAHIQTFENPEKLVGKLAAAGWFDSIHLALNRKDVSDVMGEEFARRSAQAKQAFEKSAEAAGRTLEGELIKLVIADWEQRGHRGSIIYEEFAGSTATNRRVQKAQKAILTNTVELVESTPAN